MKRTPPTQSKSERAYEWVKGRITGRDIAPGYRIVLAAIAEELDMSVVPVREALRRLEAEGLVTFERNVGARVAMADDRQYRYSMHTLGVLEGAATALSAPLVTADRLAVARAINAELAATLDDFEPMAFAALNQRFHTELFAPCPNPRLLELVDLEWARLARLRSSTFSFVPDRARESVREHEAILDLIEARAPAGEIERAARQHRNAILDAYVMHEHPDEVNELAGISHDRAHQERGTP